MTAKEAKSFATKLRKEFGGKVEFEPLNGNGRYRFAIESKRFNGVPVLQRQDEVWESVNRLLPSESTLDISVILTFAPADLALSE
jgi:hypothetical protein